MRIRRSASRLCASLLLGAAAVACASTSPHAPPVTHTRPDPSIPKCAGDQSATCITMPSCQYDEKHQCEACLCSPAWQSPQQTRVAPFGQP